MKKGTKKVAKKSGKKAAGQKSEESLAAAAESLTTLPGLQNEPVSEETQAILEAPDKEPGVKEPAVQPLPPIHEEPVLAQVIIKSYEGEQVDEFYEGEGFICFEGGNTYKGLFSEGFMNGEGTYTWADGVKYEGTFTKNVLMHNGSYTWNDGSVYEGSIQDGLRHGFGVFRSGTHPISYTGYWCNGKRHGKGLICYDQEQTSWYSGDWVNNVREGFGLRRYRSGNTYQGQWKKNLRHGYGQMKWVTDNQEYTGHWVCGLQHGSGIHTWFLDKMQMSQYSLRNEYVGDFVKGERHGYGTYIYASGEIYAGGWVHNKKHGKGMFIFKNGHVFQDKFVKDRPVQPPVRREAAVKPKKLRATSTRSHSGTIVLPYFIYFLENTTMISAWGKTSLLGSYINLNIPSLLDLFPRYRRDEELKQVELAVLRHISKLRRAYYFYSTLGNSPSPDGTYTLTWLQFWRFLKDCGFHLSKTLAEMDRLLRVEIRFLKIFLGDNQLEKIHCPRVILLFREFVSYLVQLAFHIYHEEYKDKVPHLQNCFLEMMARNVLPSASRVQGILYSGEEFTSFAMNYADKCWEIYEDFCRPCPGPLLEPTVKMRQFLWKLADFKLLSEELTAPRVVGIFVKVGAIVPGIHGLNLELEMVFLEFFEALLECALVYVTEDMIQKKEAQDNQKSSLEIKELSKETSAVPFTEHSLSQVSTGWDRCPMLGQANVQAQEMSVRALWYFEGCSFLCHLPSSFSRSHLGWFFYVKCFLLLQNSNPRSEVDTDLCELIRLWISQVEIFFTTKFFPAFEHEKVLRDKIEEIKKQDAELAELRKIQAEELGK
ncbi:RS10B protein, partial [Cettia cetti]|nr:RS10B protein [Cettia cetti]